MVGTKTIRENYSREGGLDYIVNNGGTITEAVSTQVWSGDADVHVSIVNWSKAKETGLKRLYTQVGDKRDSPWKVTVTERINAALSDNFDVTTAKDLLANQQSESCYQGQTHGHKGFLLNKDKALQLLRSSARNAQVIYPFLTGNELIGSSPPRPKRYVIDFQPRNIIEASEFEEPFDIVKTLVLPTREIAARAEAKRNEAALNNNPQAKVNWHHRNFLERWWLLSYGRGELIRKLSQLSRYIVCVRVTKRPIFEFIDSAIRPNDALQVFTYEDDYSFGILQSGVHWDWFTARCSKLTARFRYTSESVYDTFAWPQEPSLKQIKDVAKSAVQLRELRQKTIVQHQKSLRGIYRTLDLPGRNPIKEAQKKLDEAVQAAYGMKPATNRLEFLLNLNTELVAKESRGESITGPGLPLIAKGVNGLVTADSVRPMQGATYPPIQ